MPAVTPWYTGAQVPLTFLLTDTLGNPQNAVSTQPVVTITKPDGTTATPVVGAPSPTGTYGAIYLTTQPGHHLVTWSCLDTTYPGAFADTFEVQVVPDPTIVSLAEAKEILHLTSTTSYDAKIQGYNAAVTNWIEYVCGPCVQQTIVERLPSRGVTQALSKPPVISLLPWTTIPPALANAGIAIPSPPSPMFPTATFGAGFAYPLTLLYADPATGIVNHTSWLPFIYGYYLWQYTAGRLVIPGGIYEAAKIALKHIYYVESGGAGGALGAGDAETTATPFGFAVPNRAMELLLPYRAASQAVAV